MNDFERHLTDLLHAGTPQPQRVITASEIAELAQEERAPRGRRSQRWGVPLMAAAAVLVAVAVPVFVIGHDNNSPAPTSPSSSAPTSTPSSSPTPTPTASDTTGSVATCLTSQLSLGSGPSGAAAGSTYTTFFFTNTAGTPCAVRGFPGVSLLNDAGSMVGQPATRDGSEAPTVRLAPGQRAQFTLRVSTATQTGCDLPRPSSQIQVYPPEQTVPLRKAFATGSCTISVQSLTPAH
ncbi:MAG: DUF4232 domain-containing protein [Phycicoccus sp.]|nr:DUF4232 domain-containing protein [Phycicoccus sp.]NMM34155.1 DUF4232 domain-containing protein [Phycicoccus sp.]